MLILVVVSIRIALDTGLFESAGKATKDWEEAQDKEAELGNGKVKITATDENNKIKYITYKWNDEDETVIELPSATSPPKNKVFVLISLVLVIAIGS